MWYESWTIPSPLLPEAHHVQDEMLHLVELCPWHLVPHLSRRPPEGDAISHHSGCVSVLALHHCRQDSFSGKKIRRDLHDLYDFVSPPLSGSIARKKIAEAECTRTACERTLRRRGCLPGT